MIMKRSIISILCMFILVACVPTNQSIAPAFLASSPEHYSALGIVKDAPAIWEDGIRTDGQEGSYEWWYVDTEFDDGTTVVVVFFTKNGFDVAGPARPTATLQATFADGSTMLREIYEEGKVIDAASDKADVRVQDAYLRYVDGNYELKFVHEDITYEAFMTSQQPMYRPETGYMYFGAEQEHFFAWFVAQPSADVVATLTRDGVSQELHGHGYHDHNWGNIAMNELINHWYWGRVSIGGYTIITSDIIAEAGYGYTRIPLMFIANDGGIIQHDLRQIQVERADTVQHPETQKFIDNHLTFRQVDENGVKYTVEYFRQEDIAVNSLLRNLPPFTQFMARLVGANPTYIRSLGTVKLTVEDGDTVQVFESEGLWEQMAFGSNREAIIGTP